MATTSVTPRLMVTVYLPITPQIFADYSVIGRIEDIRTQELLLSTVTKTSARI